MRFAILPLVSHPESQFVPARDDVLILVAPPGCALSGQMTLPTAFYKPLALCLALNTSVQKGSHHSRHTPPCLRGAWHSLDVAKMKFQTDAGEMD